MGKGNGVTYDSDAGTQVVNSDNVDPVTFLINGNEIPLEPGEEMFLTITISDVTCSLAPSGAKVLADGSNLKFFAAFQQRRISMVRSGSSCLHIPPDDVLT